MTMQHTHDEYGDMLLILGTCNCLVLMHGNTRCVNPVDSSQTLTCFDDYSSVSVQHDL